MTKTKNQPLVSILTPSFNSGRFIRQCIESVLNQDYPRVEQIIQDGGSTDTTVKVLKEYSQSNHRHQINWVSEPDTGQADGLNKALQRSKGDILLVLNADDVLLANACSWGVTQLLKHPKAAVVYGDEYIINQKGEVVDYYIANKPYSFDKLFCVELVPPAQAAFIRRAHFEQVGLYADTSLETCPDYEMWVRLGLKFPMLHIHQSICMYRHHSDSEGMQPDMVDKMVKAKKTVIDRVVTEPKTPKRIRQLKNRAHSGLYSWAAEMARGAKDYPKGMKYQFKSLLAYPRISTSKKFISATKQFVIKSILNFYHAFQSYIFTSLPKDLRNWLTRQKRIIYSKWK